MGHIESSHSAGIGTVGQVAFSNNNTRAIYVASTITSSDLAVYAGELFSWKIPRSVNRRILKAITAIPYPIGASLPDTPLTTEACISFDHNNQPMHYVVSALNTGERTNNGQIPHLITDLSKIASSNKYRPQSGKEMIKWVRQHGVPDFRLLQINPSNFLLFQNALQDVYAAVFSSYPYDIVEYIKQTCRDNCYVVAVENATDKVLSITGAEMLNVAGIPIAEIGDSASQPGISGLGTVVKRFLFQTLIEQNRVPALAFTDSRLARDYGVIKANIRAGLILDPRIILPNHTQISSSVHPAHTVSIRGANGTIIQVENMTMMYADGNKIKQVISQYGGISQ